MLLVRQCKEEIDNFFYYHLIAIHLSSDGSAAVLLSHLKFFLGLCCCCFSNVELRAFAGNGVYGWTQHAHGKHT